MSNYNEIIGCIMSTNDYEFYECDNLQCRLRFPGHKGYPHTKRCPLCRSNIHEVAVMKNINKQDNHIGIQSRSKVEALLDNVRSAWNVGSIFRTADGTGIQKLYLCGITPTPENYKVSKTSLGAEASIPWEKFNNGVHLAGLLKSKGHVLWALEDLPEAVPLFQVDFPPDNDTIILILGNEVTGVDPGIIRICDKVVSIPMLGKKQSYNVAVAFGIVTSFLLYRQSVSQGSFSILPST
jgi:23S rRNA (guanosine2251-2'-O)-methyltransferase